MSDDDIVTRLEMYEWWDTPTEATDLMNEAAAEIKRLRGLLPAVDLDGVHIVTKSGRVMTVAELQALADEAGLPDE